MVVQFLDYTHGRNTMSGPIKSFTSDVPFWRPRISPLDMEEATAEQLEAMKAPDSNTKIGEFIRVLALDSETLLHLMPLLNEVMYGDGGLSRPETELGAVSASVANRSIYCVAAHSHQYNQLTEDHRVMNSIFSLGASAEFDPRQKALFQFEQAHDNNGKNETTKKKSHVWISLFSLPSCFEHPDIQTYVIAFRQWTCLQTWNRPVSKWDLFTNMEPLI